MTLSNSRSPGSQEWDEYWSRQSTSSHTYGRIASFYRQRIIRGSLRRTISEFFSPGSVILHSGCGSGEVDIGLEKFVTVIALDSSMEASRRYQLEHKPQGTVIQGDLFAIPLRNSSLDGVFNLGVMEHFTEEQIVKALREMKRVLKPNGLAVLYWPPQWGLSVNVLRLVTGSLRLLLRREVKFHPDEINRISSRRKTEKWIASAGFSLEAFRFGYSDLFTHQIVVVRSLEAKQ
jgi:ubiquinone/menaquinone biosynthesis C-methylase UbiE